MFNLVNGAGPVVGEVLASHPEVDMVSFTGSTRAGKRVAELAAHSVKRVALELGGKVGQRGAARCRFSGRHQGQRVSSPAQQRPDLLGPHPAAGTRRPLRRGQGAGPGGDRPSAIGPSLDEASKLGPLISAAQRDRVLGFIEQGSREGAELVAGAGRNGRPSTRGISFNLPSLRVKPGDTLAREEIFGPVLVIITYRDEEEAIRIANDTIYGLGGGVWRVTKPMPWPWPGASEPGRSTSTGGLSTPQAPFGGYKQSGNGRENGIYGFEEFLEYKSLQFQPA